MEAVNNYKISIILPVYNAELYLNQCLDSIVGQTLKEFEVICVDDGSTDGSLDILREYAGRDERFKVLTQQNGGGGKARNTGMAAASGDYVIFLDSDDFFAPTLLEETCQKAEECQADIVLFDGKGYDNLTGEFVDGRRLRTGYLPDKEVFNYRDIPDNIFLIVPDAPWLRLFRREFIENTGLKFQCITNANDAFFTVSAMVLAERICSIDKPFVYYRLNNAASTQGIKDKDPLCQMQAYTAIYDFLKARDIYREVERSFVNRMIAILVWSLKSYKSYESRCRLLDLLRDDEKWMSRENILNREDEFYLTPAFLKRRDFILCALEVHDYIMGCSTEKNAFIEAYESAADTIELIKNGKYDKLDVSKQFVQYKFNNLTEAQLFGVYGLTEDFAIVKTVFADEAVLRNKIVKNEDRIAGDKKKIERQERKIEKQERKIEKQEETIEKYKQKNEKLAQQLESIKKSRAYRIGNFFSRILRKFRK